MNAVTQGSMSGLVVIVARCCPLGVHELAIHAASHVDHEKESFVILSYASMHVVQLWCSALRAAGAPL